MARSKKNGVKPKSETKKHRTVKGGDLNSGNPATGKSGSKSSATKRRSRKGNKVDPDNVDFDQDQRSNGATVGPASGKSRDAMREELMTQVTALISSCTHTWRLCRVVCGVTCFPSPEGSSLKIFASLMPTVIVVILNGMKQRRLEPTLTHFMVSWPFTEHRK